MVCCFKLYTYIVLFSAGSMLRNITYTLQQPYGYGPAYICNA